MQSPSSTNTDTLTPSGPKVAEIGEPITLDDGTAITVSSPSVQKDIITDTSDIYNGVGADGMQWVVLSVTAGPEFWPPFLAIERDGELKDPPHQSETVKPMLRTCTHTCTGVAIRTGETTEAFVVYNPTGDEVLAKWRLPKDIVSLFSVEPDLALRSAELVENDGELGIRATVENIGPRDAGFRALIDVPYLPDVADPVAFPVPKGESVTGVVTSRNIREMDPDRAFFTHEIGPGTRAFVVDARREGGTTATTE